MKEMATELLALSNVKLRLLALVSEHRHLREQEGSAREELRLATERHNQIELEFEKKLQDLQNRVVSQDESMRRLESKIKYLEDEKEYLERKESESKETIRNLLQSRETFLCHYKDSTCLLKQTIQTTDKKLALLSDKIHAHIFLFDSIQKEAAAVKEVVDNVESLVNEKEHIVTGLKRKINQISSFEKDFIKRIVRLEEKLSNHQNELQKRDTSIIELKEQIHREKVKGKFQLEVEEKALLVKDEIINRLTSDKQKLHLELHSMQMMIRRIQDIASNMNAEDVKVSCSALVNRGMPGITSGDNNESSAKVIGEHRPDFSDTDSIINFRDHAVVPLLTDCQVETCSGKKSVSSLSQPFVSSPTFVSCGDLKTDTFCNPENNNLNVDT